MSDPKDIPPHIIEKWRADRERLKRVGFSETFWHKRIDQQFTANNSRLRKLFKTRNLLRDRWQDSNMREALRIMVDKNIMGFACKSVERLNDLMTRVVNVEQLKVKGISNAIIKSVRLHVHHEMKSLARDVKADIRKMTLEKVGDITYNPERSNTGEKMYSGAYKIIDNSRKIFEKEGVRYRKMILMINEDDFLKFRACLQLEGTSFPKWLRLRMKKFVSFRFKEIAKIKDLADPFADATISDEEFREDGDLDAKQEATNFKEKEITKPQNNNEDLKAGGS